MKLYLSQNGDIYLNQKLTSYLMKNYDKTSKPEGLVNISIQISIKQIVGIQEKDQTITLNIWVSEGWKDPRLSYNSSQFGGLPYTTVPSDKLWM